MESHPPDPNPSHPRWALMRDVAKFQVKLLVDGLRDLLMSPASLIAALGGLLFDSRHPDRAFHQLLDFGQRTERWINLFDHRVGLGDDPGIDELFGRLEQRLVEQYERGGATASAKNAVDRSLDGIHRGLERLRDRVVARGRDGVSSPGEDESQPPG